MRSLLLWILLIFCIIGIFSCKKHYKTVQCREASTLVRFIPADSPHAWTDTAYTFILYTKGTNLTNQLARYRNCRLKDGHFTNCRYADPTTVILDSPDNGADNSVVLNPYYHYDMQITLHPSGRVYKIKDIVVTPSAMESESDIECFSKVNYSVNDSLYVNPGGGITNAIFSLPVKY